VIRSFAVLRAVSRLGGTLTCTIGYPGVKLVRTNSVETLNYAFPDLTIAPTTKPGRVQIIGWKGSQT
jgi:neopullulanase